MKNTKKNRESLLQFSLAEQNSRSMSNLTFKKNQNSVSIQNLLGQAVGIRSSFRYIATKTGTKKTQVQLGLKSKRGSLLK